MASPQIVLLGVLVIAFLAALRWVGRRSTECAARLLRELEASGEPARRGPEPAVYRGGSGRFSRVKGNGVLALTDKRIVFDKLLGSRVEIATIDIAGVHESKWFLRSAVGAQVHVVVKTRSGEEVGFFVRDREAWVADLHAHATEPSVDATTA